MPAPISPIELCLFAPYNEEVALIGSWNNWQRQPMTKGDDGWWRITSNIGDGRHLYKFAVKSKSYFARDQWLEVFDPYGASITDDEHERTHLAIKNGQRVYCDYQWQHDDVPLPKNEELILYELHVGDFSGGKGDEGTTRTRGKFANVIDKLDYLAELGINCIELMPVKEFPFKSWGYNLRSLFAVDSGYGPPSELCRLVDECHGRGMRVIIDGVYNHADADAPLAKIDYEYWFYKDNPDPPNLQWGPKFNYGHYDEKLKLFPARKYVIESIEFWVEHFHIDGIRFDATRAIGDFNIMREFCDAAFKKVDGRKPFFTVAEHIPEDPAIVGYPKGPMVAAWHDTFSTRLQAIATRHEHDGIEPWDLDGLEQKMNPATNGFGSGNHVVNYLTSHDRERIMRQLGEQANLFGEAAFRRVKLAITLLLTTPGLPMLRMGQEFGDASTQSLEPRPIDWSLLANQNNRDLRDYVAGMVKLRRNTPALCGDLFQAILKDVGRHLFAYKRWNHVGGVAVVVANLEDTSAGEIKVENAGLEDGVWHDYAYNCDTEVKGGILNVTLGASEAKVFVKK